MEKLKADLVFACKDCGHTGLRIRTENYVHPCVCCNSRNVVQLDITPKEYLKILKKGYIHAYLAELYPEESKSWNANREKAEIEHRKFQQSFKSKGIAKAKKPEKPVPKCPVCGSTRLVKISASNKIGTTMVLGVFALGHISKTYKCKDCGMKF